MFKRFIFSAFIARSYFFSKKLNKSINIISLISLLSITFATTALVVVLSIYNGFEKIITSYFNKFNPDLVIQPKDAKYITADSTFYSSLSTIEGIKCYSKILQTNCMIEYEDVQHVAPVFGVDENYSKVNSIDSLIISGENDLLAPRPRAIIGASIAQILSVNVNFLSALRLYFPDKTAKFSSVNPEAILRTDYIKPGGIFSLSSEDKSNAVIVPFSFLKDLIKASDNSISALNIKLKDGVDNSYVKGKIKDVLGSNYYVKNKDEQEEELYKLLQVEKIGIFVILCFLIFIASFSIVSSVVMLIINKQTDIKILDFLGTPITSIKQIFFFNSLYIISVGAFLGILFGSLIALIQEYFHVIKVYGLILDYYPVELRGFDVLIVLVSVVVMALLISLFPVVFMTKTNFSKSK